MATKTISVSTDAYDILKANKLPDESFTDVIKRIASKTSMMSFFGILSKKEADELEKNVREGRKKTMMLHVKRMKRIRDTMG